MALQMNYTTQDQFGNNVVLSNCYIKISKVSGDKNTVSAYVDFTVNADDGSVLQRLHRFSPDMDGDNFIRQAYEHLKTLSEFSGATDV
tara:strand:+ start:884 stop:1147 length:264 start_codon:yes stop_codon:yes gene_type:complete